MTLICHANLTCLKASAAATYDDIAATPTVWRHTWRYNCGRYVRARPGRGQDGRHGLPATPRLGTLLVVRGEPQTALEMRSSTLLRQPNGHHVGRNPFYSVQRQMIRVANRAGPPDCVPVKLG